jgi:hypothetical protein
MNHFEAVYIGSRHDTTPLKMLSIKKWILMLFQIKRLGLKIIIQKIILFR